VLDDRDRKFVEALQGLNLSKSAAALITYLANVKEATSREIEIGTGLRQPEVSVGVRTLHENKWVTEYVVRSERKGRPMKVYSLRTSLDEILNHFEEERSHESTLAMEAIQRLKEMAID
jgi:predicted transcriptional regulator